MSAERFAAVLEKIRSDIERVGWSAIGVFPAAGSDPTVVFTYTIGLTEMDHPELVIYGLPNETAHSLLYSAVEQVRAGVVFEPGQRYGKIIRDFEVYVRDVSDVAEVNAARAYYDRPVEALQLVWPDSAGRMPFVDDDVDAMTQLGQTPPEVD